MGSDGPPKFRSPLHGRSCPPVGGASLVLLQQAQDGLVVLGSVQLSLAPNCIQCALLDPADLNGASGGASGVALDFNLRAVVLLDVVLEPGGWASIASCSAVFDVDDFRHNDYTLNLIFPA